MDGEAKWENGDEGTKAKDKKKEIEKQRKRGKMRQRKDTNGITVIISSHTSTFFMTIFS